MPKEPGVRKKHQRIPGGYSGGARNHKNRRGVKQTGRQAIRQLGGAFLGKGHSVFSLSWQAYLLTYVPT